MTTIQFPRMRYPFPTRINKSVYQAQEHVTAWVQDHHLLASDDAIARFSRSRFAWLVARAFPDAGPEELNLIADLNAWLFIFDDQNDEAETGKVSAYLRSIMAGLRDILHYNKTLTLRNAGPIPAALSDIWARLRIIGSPAWRLRFIRTMEDYFSACIWEAENRGAHIIPSVKDYTRMRLHTGALLVDVEAIEVIEKVFLPVALREHPTVERMVLAANNVVCWANDMFSCFKEARQGDVHNLVLVLRHERNLSLQEALDEAARMHDEEVQLFAALEKQLPLQGNYQDWELLRFVSVLQSWMTGNFAWSMYDTGRYNQLMPAVSDTEMMVME